MEVEYKYFYAHTTVTPNITTKRRDAIAITITAMPHWGSTASSSGAMGVGSSRFGKTKIQY